jgi:threonylcarbamoyladenosine tRNA methylthiotransferase MtaB
MARKTTPQAYAQLLADARQAIPDVAITTDLMVGFPGESQAEFRQSLEFVAQMGFARGHVFTFSERPGTAAARMPGVVPYPVRKTRNAEMRAVFDGMARTYREEFVGKHLLVLWERARDLGQGSWELNGLSDNYLRVSGLAPEPAWNRIDGVLITAAQGEGLIGEIQL